MTKAFHRLSFGNRFFDGADNGDLLGNHWGMPAIGTRAAIGLLADDPVPQAVPPTISLANGVAYTQNFDALSNTAGSTTNVLTIDGWAMTETGGGARDNEQYAVDTGGSTTGDTFSYGAAANTDRALGELRSGTLIPNFGAAFTNTSGATITSLLISYDGEQWRFGGVHATVAERLDFQISFDATDLTTGTWTDVNALDFNPTVVAGTAGAQDGNANHVSISSTITSLTIANGATFWIRWQDVDATGADDGLAVDNFSITASTGAVNPGIFSINDVSHAEGNSGATAYTFTVSRSSGSSGAVAVDYTISAPGGAGNADTADFVAGTIFSGTVNFADGQASQTITVNVQGDVAIEGNELFSVFLTNATGGATISDDTGVGTITNDDSAGAISVNDPSFAEGDSGTTAGFFTLTRTGGSTGSVSVDYVITLPGGAGGADGSDVTGPLTGTVTFTDGQTSAQIPFTIVGDTVNEPDETLTVTLSNPIGGVTIGDASGTATITNDDAPAAASIGDVSVVEGNDGVVYLVFTVTLNKADAGTISYHYQSADVSATAGSDYLPVSGTVSFAPGETSRTISVPVIGDHVPEASETLTVTLSNPIGGTIADGSATGTITNDDGQGYYSLAGGSFSQNWTDTNQITTNDNWSGVPFIIGHLGQDITTATGVNPGTLTGDSAVANDIDVIANQSNPNTLTSGGVAEFQLADPTIALQGSGTADAPHIILYMDSTGREDITVSYRLRDLDASTDNSVQPVALQYRIGDTGAWTNVPIAFVADATTGPSLNGPDILVTATLPADAANQAQLEIRIMTTNAVGNDEWVGIDDIVVSSDVSAPSLSISNAAVFEGDAGTTPISFTVTRAGSSTGTVDADYTVSFGNGAFDAQANDFVAGQLFTGTVHFADGQTSATITLGVQGDLVAEGDDGFTVTLSNPVGGTIGDGVATGTIVNDDGAPSLITVNDVMVTEGDSGTSLMTFTVTRTGGTGAFDVDYHTVDGTAIEPGDYVAANGTIHFGVGDTTQTVSITINGDTDAELNEQLQLVLTNATNNVLIADPIGIGTIIGDDPIFIHQIQGDSYFSPILAAEGIHNFNVASVGVVIVRAVVTAVDADGPRQGFYVSEEMTDWDGNNFTSEGIFVMTRNDAGIGTAVSGVAVGDLVTVSAHVMEYKGFTSNMPATTLVNPSSIVVNSSGNALPTFLLDASHAIPNEIMTGVTPDYFDSADGVGNSFDAANYGLSYWETVEGMLVTIPDMVVADGFVSTSGGDPIFQAYSTVHANADQINSRGGYTVAGDPPIGPPDTPNTGDDTTNGGRVLHDGDINPDIIEVDFTGFASAPSADYLHGASMGDHIGDVTGIIDFDFTDRKLFVTDIDPGSFVNGVPERETTALGGDDRALTVATFNVENLDPGDGAARFTAIANAIANNLNSPDIISIEEMQDNNGAAAGDGSNPTGTDASQTWQMLVDALNLATGGHYQWVDQAPVYNAEGGEQSGNIRVGFLYNTDRVQLGDLDPNATLAERRAYTDRIGDGVRDAGDLIQFSDDMLGAEINTNDWTNTRRSLLGQFTFHGNTVFVAANHFPAKGGSGDFWQFDQTLEDGDPANSGWAQRNQVGQDLYSMLNLIQSGAPDAGIASGGDYNDFYFYRPLTTVTGYTMADGTARVGGARFDNLTLTLPEAERYTYAFDGRSQAIDHIVVNDLLAGLATYDVVHLNTGYNPTGTGIDAVTPLSDHDPALSSYDFRERAELLLGTSGNDAINGFGGNDQISSGAGNDELIGGTGADILAGGDDDDFYTVDALDTVIETATGGHDNVFALESYTLNAGAYVEVLSTTNHAGTAAINLTGNELGQVILGNAGANFLVGGGGADVLAGFGGDDFLIVDSADDVVREDNGGGYDNVCATASFVLTVGAYVEILSTTNHAGTAAIDLSGNELHNIVLGNAGANTLFGGSGGDIVAGFGGDDIIYANSNDIVREDVGGGTDTVRAYESFTLDAGAEIEVLETANAAGTAAINLAGNELAQTVHGNAGANFLNGLAGADTLTGGGGADIFQFSTALGGGNVDAISDFDADDTIQLSHGVFGAIGFGTLSGSAFVAGTAAGDGDDRILYDSATGQIFYDADGNGSGAAVLFATVTAGTTVTASDFFVI